jgi:DNA helicase-2/ATP-dependent DNA helicase PcrA
MAVLVRAGFQLREFEERFIQLGLPYRVIGGPRFYERQEIRDALAYLRVVAQPNDDLALERIINVPKRGIGNATVQTLYAHARAQGISLYASIRDLCQTEELKPKMRGTLMKLIDDFERWRGLSETEPHGFLAVQILDESGYTDMWKADKSPDAPGRLDNLKEFVSSMEDYENLAAFLEHVALVMDNQNSAQGEHVTLMTLHAAKGLEFDYVFLPGWEDGLFPSQRSMDENGLKGLEEERRLAYVALTRARKRATVSYVGNRRMYGSWVSAFPSRFVNELPEDHIIAEADSGLYAPGRSSHWDSSGMEEMMSGTKGGPSDYLSGRKRVDARMRQTESGLKTGDKVFHDKFGEGVIIHVDGKKLDIQFDRSGLKRVVETFVTKR